MRRILSVLAVTVAVGVPRTASADEGMWMLHQVPELQAKLAAMGLRLTADEIWNAKSNSGLASAVAWLGGCSSSFVSPDGLVITNHHCAFGAIQLNSSPEHDYITNGFLAKSRAEELEARGSRVNVFLGYDDVTAAVQGAAKAGMKAEERQKAVENARKQLIAECEKAGVRCSVAEMYGGAKFYLFRMLELRDVRLVYAPPRAIGEYGGEVDNWMWPRHTGDYSFLRAYVGPDGKPADYSPSNVPYHPVRWLKIATDPLREGDFTMIMGYPGRTMRYRLANAIAEDTEFNYPQQIRQLRDVIAILENESKRGKDVEIKLASQLKGLYNTVKKAEGMLEGLTRSDLVARKRAQEQQLAAWIAADPKRVQAYGDVLPAMEKLIAERRATREHDMVLGWFGGGRGGGLLSAAAMIERWTGEKAKPDLERELGFQQRDERMLRQRLGNMQRNLDLPSERAVLRYSLKRASELPSGRGIAAVDQLLAATGQTGDAAIDAALETLYGGTKLADVQVRQRLFDADHATVVAIGDSFIAFAAALRKEVDARQAADRRYEGEMLGLSPRFFAALGAWRNAPLYPDANSTLRFTFATVKGYQPRDAVIYTPFTTLRGVVEKNTGADPFKCPQRLLDAAKPGSFGPYVDARLNDVPACFLSTNDITGGNSGSPIMNGKGELVGLAFDGDYESMTSDYLFSDALSRTINVDVRYVLWCMDFVDKADTLLREIGVSPQHK
jgi:hypothetical protein